MKRIFLIIEIVVLTLVFGIWQCFADQGGAPLSQQLPTHGHTSAMDGGILPPLYSQSNSTTTTTTTLSSVNVLAGDIVMFCSFVQITGGTLPTYPYIDFHNGTSGTASLFFNGYSAGSDGLVLGGLLGSTIIRINGCLAAKIGIGGTLIPESYILQTGGSGNSYIHSLYVYFIRKQ